MAREKAIFAAGCFWGVEEEFRATDGVLAATVGYCGGHAPKPSYELVCSGRTGHAESVLVEFDPERVGYEQLLEVFWGCHDPTTRNRQGPDHGTQYRSAIFYLGPQQQMAARLSKEKLESSGRYSAPIVTEITAASEFHPAEEYHQQYFEKRGRH